MQRASVSGERRLMLVMGAVVFTDTMFYAAITPLLPTLAHSLHLSKLSAGVLTASYAIGTLVAAIPSGILAARIGPKRTVYVGLGLLATSTLAFGFVQNIALLDAARFVEGVGGACSWAGGLAWIVAEASPSRRGEMIGGALGAAIAGALFGPVIGTLANALGRGPAFSAVVVLALILIWQAERLPLTHAPSGQGVRQLGRALHDRKLLVGVWLVTLPAMAGGAVAVLGPLRLHAFGAGAAAIGATYLVGSAAEAIVTPAVGRVSDRRGRIIPLRAGLVVTIALLVCFTVPSTELGLALLIVALTTSVGAFWAPAMAMQSDAAEAQHLDQAIAAALMNLAWAVGVTIGEVGAGAIAKSSGDRLPMLLLAGVCGVTLAALVPRRSVQRIGRAVPDGPETEVG